MAATAVTPTILVMDTASSSLTDAGATDVATAADGWTISAALWKSGDRMLLKFVDDGSGCTVTIAAGDNPPAARAGLGALTITLTASQVKYVVIDPSRFTQDDGTLVVTSSTDEGTRMGAFLLPKMG